MIFRRNKIIPWVLVVIIIAGQVPWVIWDFLWIRGVLNIIIFILSLIYLKNINRNKIYTLVAIMFLLIYFIIHDSFNLGTTSLFVFIVAVVIIPNELKIKTVLLLNKVTTYILIPGVILYALYLIGINLPYTEMYSTWKEVAYKNYFFFIIKVSYNFDSILDLFRFYSIFDEPGTLGTFLIFLIAINRFELTKRNVFFFIVGLFTFSLAFIVLFFIGLVLFKFKFSIKRFIIILSTTVVIFTIFNSIPILEENILQRLEYNDGKVSGNNRTSEKTDEYFSRFITSNNALIGLGAGKYLYESEDRIGNSSYKIFIIDYGILGAAILIFIYVMLMPKKLDKHVLYLFILFFISFLQRPYSLSAWQIILFSSGIAYLIHMKKIKLSK
tara:strand:+ start:10939 stop:12090 length:1152 start_codon:yes stop_codon:yes gene_type:complete